MISEKNVDSFDRAILRIVQSDASIPLRAIADRVNLSRAAVQRRLRRMEEEGVIVRNVAMVDPSKIGKHLTVLVEVQIVAAEIEILDRVKHAFKVPEVQQCYNCTGDADFVLIMVVSAMEEYNLIARKLLYENKDVKWFRTLVVYDRVKVGVEVPVDL